jgi:NADH:ubiquinone oxidoreductase subunit F (NADH-binding)
VADEELGAPKAKEVRVVLRNVGKIDPLNIEDYISEDGYLALAQVISDADPLKTLELIKNSGLRGRGGAGFSGGRKWELARNASGKPK